MSLETARARWDRRQELTRQSQEYECGECGQYLVVAYIGGEDRLCCGRDKSHEGIVKRKSQMQLYREGAPVPVHTANKLDQILEKQKEKETKEMVERIGEARTQALEQYRGVTSLTLQEATTIIDTVWKGAPKLEVYKAAVLCRDYGLNPLMKHVFLIKFDRYERRGNDRVKVGEDWVTVLGIAATRLIASRPRRGETVGSPPSYVDGPRKMTEAEQTDVFGEVDAANLTVLVKLKDMRTGAEAPGYGKWPLAKDVKGADKGNSKFNMASIRAERQALEKLRPGEMPKGIEVIDERYAPSPGDAPETLEGQVRVVEEGLALGEEAPDDQQFEELKSAAPGPAPYAENKVEHKSTPPSPAKPTRLPADLTQVDVPDINDLMDWCFKFWSMQPADVLKEANQPTMAAFWREWKKPGKASLPFDTFGAIRAVRAP